MPAVQHDTIKLIGTEARTAHVVASLSGLYCLSTVHARVRSATIGDDLAKYNAK